MAVRLEFLCVARNCPSLLIAINKGNNFNNFTQEIYTSIIYLGLSAGFV